MEAHIRCYFFTPLLLGECDSYGLGSFARLSIRPYKRLVTSKRMTNEDVHSSRRIPSSSMCSDFWPSNMFRCDIAKPLNRYSTVQISSLGNQLNIKPSEPSSSFRTMPAWRLLQDGIREFGIGIAKEPSADQYRLWSTSLKGLVRVQNSANGSRGPRTISKRPTGAFVQFLDQAEDS